MLERLKVSSIEVDCLFADAALLKHVIFDYAPMHKLCFAISLWFRSIYNE